MRLARRERLAVVAGAIARRADAISRRGPGPQVPRLRAGAVERPATVWMIAPDWDKPSGGVRKQYRAVDVLNAAGVAAAIVHHRPGFACTWFEHATRIVAADELVVGPRDVLAVPEIYGTSILNLPRGIRQVIYNQNVYLTLDAIATTGLSAAAPYLANPDLGAVATVSEENAEVLRYVFPDAPIHRIRHGLDPTLHHAVDRPAGRRIAYMPRRRPEEAAQVLSLLELRGALDGWEVIAIDGRSEAEVAELLQSSRIFLSFSEREGFGLPPCEAFACGCLVVGFDGFAGREFFRRPFARTVPNGDVAAFARELEALMRQTDEQPEQAHAAAMEGARFVHERYSTEVERRDLVGVFAPPVVS